MVFIQAVVLQKLPMMFLFCPCAQSGTIEYDYSNPLVLKLPAAYEFLSLDGNNMPLEFFQNNVLNSVDFFYKDHLYQEIKQNF